MTILLWGRRDMEPPQDGIFGQSVSLVDDTDALQMQADSGLPDAMHEPGSSPDLDPDLQSWLFLSDEPPLDFEGVEDVADVQYSPSSRLGGLNFKWSDAKSSVGEQSVEARGLSSGWEVASQSSSAVLDATSYNKEVVVDSALTSLSSQTLKQFWEKDFWHNMMSDSVDPVDMVSSGLKRPAPVMQNEESGELEVADEIVKL